MVRLACDLCPRRGQYRKEALIHWFGGDVLMPNVRHVIAECPRRNLAVGRVGVFTATLRGRRLSARG
jgi:hypothetical protein